MFWVIVTVVSDGAARVGLAASGFLCCLACCFWFVYLNGGLGFPVVGRMGL